LPQETSESGTIWLQGLVDGIISHCSAIIPSLK
jgi:hypothetical protein